MMPATLPVEKIVSKIYLIRGVKIMLGGSTGQPLFCQRPGYDIY